MSSPAPAIDVRDLRVELTDGTPIVSDVSFEVRPGEVLGVVGESGSGKTTVALAALAYATPGARITQGRVLVGDEDLLALDEGQVRSRRGRIVSYVPQDPATALNPSQRLEWAVAEMLRAHTVGEHGVREIGDALRRVDLPGEESAFRRRYPHQLSGGQQQRVTIATALVCSPRVAVLDEPTTGLDAITQAKILEEINRLRAEDLAIIYISHDLAVVAQIADRLLVMRAGAVVEHGTARDIFRAPAHEYTRQLMAAIPSIEASRAAPERSVGGGAPPALVVDELSASYGSGARQANVLHGVSFAIQPGQCLAVVGESGSGKSTLARCLAGLHPRYGGTLRFDANVLAPAARKRTADQRRRMQIVFQNPYDSLNPRHSVRDAIGNPATLFRGIKGRALTDEVDALLEHVRLPGRIATRFPGELSGGERQRVAIARALAAKPDLLICDEVTSALDVSVQASVLELLASLQREFELSMLFISHDLGVVASVSDEILVLERGEVREIGAARDVLGSPKAEYTQALLAAAPRLPSHADTPA